MHQHSDEVSFTVRGDQILGNPSISTDSRDGTATIQSGQQLCPPDWRVKFFAINPQPTAKELNGASAITKAEVYDQHGQLVAVYTPMNPGQTASIQGDISGVGDSYLRFNAGVLVTKAAGFPQLGSLVITNGTNSFLHLPVTFPVGNGAYDLCGPVNPCLRRGTLIGTPCGGLVPIEDLRVGDMVATADTGPQKIVHITRGFHGAEAVAAEPKLRPFLIGLPEDGLYISRQHRLLISLQDGEEVLISAVKLARCCPHLCREMVGWCEGIEWFNLFTELHSIIMADGYPVETGYLGGDMASKLFGNEWPSLQHLAAGHRENPARRFVDSLDPEAVQGAMV